MAFDLLAKFGDLARQLNKNYAHKYMFFNVIIDFSFAGTTPAQTEKNNSTSADL